MSILILLGPAYISAQQKTEDSRLPPKRAHHSLAFDAKLGEVVLYGGTTAAENDTFTFFDDLWTWNGRQWNRLAVTGLPRSSHHLIYDSARKRLVLIGGMAGQQRYGETRVFDGKSWVAVHDNPALALSEPAVAYDSRRQRIVFSVG